MGRTSSREAAPPPVATTLYHLTERGRDLRAVLKALGAWGSPLLASAPPEDAFVGHWLALPAESVIERRLSGSPTFAIELRPDLQAPVTVEVIDGDVKAHVGPAHDANLVVSGPLRAVVDLLKGGLDAATASMAGLTLEGDVRVLDHLGAPVAGVAS